MKEVFFNAEDEKIVSLIFAFVSEQNFQSTYNIENNEISFEFASIGVGDNQEVIMNISNDKVKVLINNGYKTSFEDFVHHKGRNIEFNFEH